jgi:hypothetical protein
MSEKKWTPEYEKEWQKEYREKTKDKRKEYQKQWKLDNPEKVKGKSKEERARVKMEVLTHYSQGIPRCASCNFNDMRALQLDHIFNNGAEERREIFGNRFAAGTMFYRWVRQQNYPEGYQVLCANCNIIKERECQR